MAYKKSRRKYAKRGTRARKSTRRKSTRRASPRVQRLEIRIVGVGPGVTASTAVLGKKSGRPVYARF